MLRLLRGGEAVSRYGEGESGKGIFHTAGHGRNFRRRPKSNSLARFAEALSLHIDEDDIAASEVLATGAPLPPNAKADPGGNVRLAARSIGLRPESGNSLLQTIRRQLGEQAR